MGAWKMTLVSKGAIFHFHDGRKGSSCPPRSQIWFLLMTSWHDDVTEFFFGWVRAGYPHKIALFQGFLDVVEISSNFIIISPISVQTELPFWWSRKPREWLCPIQTGGCHHACSRAWSRVPMTSRIHKLECCKIATWTIHTAMVLPLQKSGQETGNIGLR